MTDTKPETPRPPSSQPKKPQSVVSDHPSERAATAVQDEPETLEAEDPSTNNVDAVVEEVMEEVVAEADEALDEIMDIALSDVPRAPKMSMCELISSFFIQYIRGCPCLCTQGTKIEHM